jgi:hypothetical protein
MSRRFLTPVLLALLLLLPGSLVWACEMCRDAVINNAGSGGIDGSGSSAGLDFNSSILYMLGGVFTVAGWIGWVMYKAIRSSSPRLPVPHGFPVKSNVG